MEAMFNITINLSPDDVKQIVAEYLAKKGYFVKSNGIKFKVGEECRSYGMGKHYVTEFLGCSVNYDAGGKPQ